MWYIALCLGYCYLIEIYIEGASFSEAVEIGYIEREQRRSAYNAYFLLRLEIRYIRAHVSFLCPRFAPLDAKIYFLSINLYVPH